ncbi:hypothetical protein PLICRDRAFT_41755 [Plicaturopsis crispa FD-325 SS-3]|nr:hypothetical protein PLICRDRAFT_41755 [Plicaturopsis crispa FD-325 SS-3]
MLYCLESAAASRMLPAQNLHVLRTKGICGGANALRLIIIEVHHHDATVPEIIQSPSVISTSS